MCKKIDILKNIVYNYIYSGSALLFVCLNIIMDIANIFVFKGVYQYIAICKGGVAGAGGG